MITTAAAIVDKLDREHVSSDEAMRLLDLVPASQWAVNGGWWPDLSRHCPSRVQPAVERRPANALNVEIGTPMARCLERSPDGRGLVWWMSGGSVLAYGVCTQRACCRCAKK